MHPAALIFVLSDEPRWLVPGQHVLHGRGAARPCEGAHHGGAALVAQSREGIARRHDPGGRHVVADLGHHGAQRVPVVLLQNSPQVAVRVGKIDGVQAVPLEQRFQIELLHGVHGDAQTDLGEKRRKIGRDATAFQRGRHLAVRHEDATVICRGGVDDVQARHHAGSDGQEEVAIDAHDLMI